MNYIIFQNVSTLATYFWNGAYPISLTGGIMEQIPWHPTGEISDSEVNFFTVLAKNRKELLN